MKALVLAGSPSQAVLLNYLKRRGIYTILADNNPKAVARPFADEFVKVDLLNVEAVTQVAQELQVDFLITVCADQVLITVAKVSEALGLPCYIDVKTACDVSDKGLMKNIFHANGIPSSKHVFMEQLDLNRLMDMQYPLVIKPVDGYSSKGVRKASNEAELREFFADAARISRSGMVIVEEYVEGAEITVDFQIIDGKAHFISASNTEKVDYKDRFLAFRTFYPAMIRPETLDRIRVIGQQIADAFGLKNCPMLVQLLTDDKRESVLEFCARTGGGAKYLLIKTCTGFDPIEAVVHLTLHEPVSVEGVGQKVRFYINEFLYANAGVFDRLEGFEELKQQGILTEYWQFKASGTPTSGAFTSSDRVASFSISADTFEQLREKHDLVCQKIRLLDPQGQDILNHELLVPIRDLTLSK